MGMSFRQLRGFVGGQSTVILTNVTLDMYNVLSCASQP